MRIHLGEGFVRMGTWCGAPLFGLPEWNGRNLANGPRPDLSSLVLDLGARRGKAAVTAVLEAAGVPLTRSEIAGVLERKKGLRGIEEVLGEGSALLGADPRGNVAEEALLEAEVGGKAWRFWESLSEEERALLVLRGYASDGAQKRSFREVAEALGRLKEESYRLMERRILERLRSLFEDAGEMELAVRTLVAFLQGITPNLPRSGVEESCRP